MMSGIRGRGRFHNIVTLGYIAANLILAASSKGAFA
jgi:hypothetical protein